MLSQKNYYTKDSNEQQTGLILKKAIKRETTQINSTMLLCSKKQNSNRNGIGKLFKLFNMYSTC